MSASLGELVVSLSGNIAKFEAAMTRAEHVAAKSMAGVNASMNVAHKAMGMLGVGLSVAGIVALGKHSLDTAENLGKMAQKLGASTEELSKWRYVADQADVSQDAFLKGSKKLSEQLTAAGDATSKAAKLMSAMGVDIKGGVTPAIEKIADTFAALPDGTTKATLAVELFGKAGLDMIPLLNQGSEGIRNMKNEAERLGLVITEDMAKAAEKFNDSLKTLKFQSEAGATSIMNSLLPALNRITTAMSEAARDSGILMAAFVGLGGVMSNFVGLDATALERNAQYVKDLHKELLGLKELQSSGAILPGEVARIKALEEELAHIERVKRARKEMNAEAFAGGRASGSTAGRLERDIAALLAGGEAANGISKFQQELQKLISTIEGKAIGVSSEYMQQVTLLTNAFAVGKLSIEKYTELVGLLTAQQEFAKKINEEWAKSVEHSTKMLRALKDTIRDLEIEARVIGMTDAQRKLYLIGLEREKALKYADDADVAQINRYYDEIESLTTIISKRTEAFNSMQTFVGDMSDLAAGFADVLVSDVGGALKYLENQVKSLLAQMIKIFATRWLLQMGAAAVGAGGAGSALASAASTYGSGSLGGMALSGAYAWGTQAWAGFASASSEIALAGTAAGFVGPSATLAGGATGAGASMAGTYAGLSSTGWGVIIAAVIAIGIWASRYHRGGDKVEGSSVSSFDAAGLNTGAFRVSEEYGNRFFGGSGLDSQLEPLVTATGEFYRNLVTRMGGAFSSAGFGFGASNDPLGNAPSRVFGSAMVNGQNVFGGVMDVDDKEVDAALMLTSKRAILAALQATDFNDEIDKIFDGVGDITKLTADQIDAIIARAREMYAVLEGLETLDLTGLDVEALRAFALEGETIGQTFQRVGGAWMQLSDAFTSDATKLEKMRRELASLGTTLEAAGIQMPTTKEGWLDVMRGLDLSTEAGRNLFAEMMRLAPSFDAVGAATQRAMADFDALMSRIRPGYSAQLGQLQLAGDVSSFMNANGWTAGMTPQQVIEALRTITREDFMRYTASNQSLILSIIDLDDTMNGAAQNISNAVANMNPAYAGDPTNVATGLMSAFENRYGGILSGITDPSDRMGLRGQFIQSQMADNTGAMNSMLAQYGAQAQNMTMYRALERANLLLEEEFRHLGTDLARLTVLTAQYNDEGIAAQILELEKWKAAQQALLAGNAVALAALDEIFNTRLTAILEGAAEIATTTAEEIQRIRDNILQWREGLLLSNASPLTRTERFTEAMSQYSSTFAAAQTGDADALARYQQIAAMLLQESEGMFGRASTEYGAIFQRIRDESLMLGSPVRTGTPPRWVEDARAEEHQDALDLRGDVAGLEYEITTVRVALNELKTTFVQELERLGDRLNTAKEIRQ